MPQAVRFDASTDVLSATTGVPASTTWTVTCWVYTIGLGTRFRNAWTLNDSGVGQGASVTFRDFADALQASDYSTYGGGGVNPLTASTATWYKTALVVSGANATFYRSAEGNALVSGGVADFTPPTTPGRLYLGGDAFGSWLDGRVAAFKMWQAALNSTEVAAEFTQYRAVRTANLLRDHPFDGATTDFSGNGNTLTAGGTAVSYEAGPTSISLTADTPRVAVHVRPSLAAVQRATW